MPHQKHGVSFALTKTQEFGFGSFTPGLGENNTMGVTFSLILKS